MENTPSEPHRPDVISRRGFLGTAVTLAAAQSAMRPAFAKSLRQGTDSAMRPILAYVGTYSSSSVRGPGQANGLGIHSFQIDSSTGALSPGRVLADEASPSCLAINPSRTHLYAANESPAKPGDSAGSVSAYAIDRSDGRLTLVNTVSSGGGGPAHLSVHPAGNFVLVANYGGGSVAVLPVQPGGGLGPATDIKVDRGVLGPIQAASASPGSYAISGHDAPHAHMIQADPTGRFVISTDLGLDRILVWKFDGQAGRLAPSDHPFAAVPPGDGPRHFAFHPNGRWMFSLQEEGSTLARFDYDSAAGKLTLRQALSSLPAGFAGTSFASEVMVSSDGRFVYAANRLHDSIAIFSIGQAGGLALIGEEWTRGDYPRSFNIEPGGNFMYVCNHRGDSITAFRIDRNTGGLTFTGQYTPVGSPSSIVFLV